MAQYINPTKNTLSFVLGRVRYTVEPEQEFCPPERYAYAVEAMGLPLVTLEEYTSPSRHQKLKRQAAEARERAATLRQEAVATAAAADKAERRGDEIAPRLKAEADRKLTESRAASAEADQAAIEMLKPEPEAVEVVQESKPEPVEPAPASAAEAPKPPAKPQQQGKKAQK